MKTRSGFVSNSSSSSFIITNLTNQEKTLVDFIRDNPGLLKTFVGDDKWYSDYTDEVVEDSAEKYNKTFPPGEEVRCSFTNEGGSKVETMLRHMLEVTEDKETDEWRWEFVYNSQAPDPLDGWD